MTGLKGLKLVTILGKGVFCGEALNNVFWDLVAFQSRCAARGCPATPWPFLSSWVHWGHIWEDLSALLIVLQYCSLNNIKWALISFAVAIRLQDSTHPMSWINKGKKKITLSSNGTLEQPEHLETDTLLLLALPL